MNSETDQGEPWRWIIESAEKSERLRLRVRRFARPVTYGVYACEVGTGTRVVGLVQLSLPHVFAVHHRLDHLSADPRDEEVLVAGMFLRVCLDETERQYPYTYGHKVPWSGLSPTRRRNRKRLEHWISLRGHSEVFEAQGSYKVYTLSNMRPKGGSPSEAKAGA